MNAVERRTNFILILSGRFEFANVLDRDEPAESGAWSRPRPTGCVSCWRAVAAGARAYLLGLPWRERTITAPGSAFARRPAATLYFGRAGHVSRQAARHRTYESRNQRAQQ